MAEHVALAVDMGASSGRVVAGLFDGNRLRLEELHRFENGAVPAAGSLFWDAMGLWRQILDGLRKAKADYGQVASVGVDTWGVDYALLGRGDTILSNPQTYRDPRTEGMLARALQRVSREEIFAQTGLQFMEINTIYQLFSMRQNNSPILEMAESMLLMPDFFHWLLTGIKGNEFTNATTTQLLNPQRAAWADDLISRLDLPRKIFGDVLMPGTRLGKLQKQVADDTGLGQMEVILPGTHDTASAVMAVPAVGAPSARPNWCYISSGTWSLMGVETTEPVMTEECRALNFTNEGGVGGTVRLLKNIIGLWLVQECRRVWNAAGETFTWEDLNRASHGAPALVSLINPDDPAFLAPANMPQAIQDFCRRTDQAVPADHGAIIRTAIESLAMRYREVLASLEKLTGARIETIHIVGGGAQNQQLCQATADACGRIVIAGPIEATAIGNLMMQATAAGLVADIEQARTLVQHSFSVERYEPRDKARWDEAHARFQRLTTA